MVQANIGKLLCAYLGGEWTMPNYIEFMYPDKVKKGPQTFEEIKNHVLKRLTE